MRMWSARVAPITELRHSRVLLLDSGVAWSGVSAPGAYARKIVHVCGLLSNECGAAYGRHPGARSQERRARSEEPGARWYDLETGGGGSGRDSESEEEGDGGQAVPQYHEEMKHDHGDERCSDGD